MHVLMAQNQELLTHLRKNDNAVDESNKMETAGVAELGTDHTYYSKKVKLDVSCSSTPLVIPEDNHAVIKKEEETEDKHASLGISLPQKLQILLVSLITMWLTNPR